MRSDYIASVNVGGQRLRASRSCRLEAARGSARPRARPLGAGPRPAVLRPAGVLGQAALLSTSLSHQRIKVDIALTDSFILTSVRIRYN